MINYFILFVILLAILPYLIFFIIYTRSRAKAWLAFLIGGVFWFIAYLLRSPLLQIVLYLPFYPEPIETIQTQELLLVAYSPWYIAFSSSMAGLFEESFRFLAIKKIKLTSKNNIQLMSLGLGWGIGEAFVIHTLNLIPYLFTDFSNPIAILGAIERLIVIPFHTAMAFFVYKCIKEDNNVWLLGAILLHFSFDFFGIMVFYYVNVILGEIVLAVFTLVLVLYLYFNYKNKPPAYYGETSQVASNL